MKNSIVLLLCFCFSISLQAQEVKSLSLKEAIHQAWENSNKSKIAEEQVIMAERKLNVTKNDQYPDVSLSGQAAYLTDPDLELKIGSDPDNADGNPDEESGSEMPTPHYLLLGQANLSLPIFSGFKLKNAVEAGKSSYKSAQFSAQNDKEHIALETIKDYVALYKARKTVDLIKQNLNSAKRRVRDFKNMEQNGLLARNDLLKAKLQQSHVELSLAQAKKSARILNYRLAKFLKLSENSRIQVDTLSFGLMKNKSTNAEQVARPDIEALRYQKEAAEKRIKVEKGNYYPSIALTGGYLAADIENTLTVKRALNIGVGISYNLSDIFKNKSDVKLAKSRAHDVQLKLDEAQDRVDVDIRNARENYQLALTNYNVYQKAREQAAENYRIVKDKYDNGLLETRDLLEADNQQLQSKIDLATAKANITQKFYELKKANGHLTDEFSNH